MSGLSFIHISDLHISFNYNNQAISGLIEQGYVNPSSTLSDLLRHIKRAYKDLDFVVVTGDLTHEGTDEEYRFVKDIINDELGALPVHVCLGNHDIRENFRLGFTEEDTAGNHPYYFEQEIAGAGVGLISLDSGYLKTNEGHISKEQLQWLSEKLKRPAENGRILMMHHPPFQLNGHPLSKYLLENTTELLEVVKGSDIFAVLCGHIHAGIGTTTGSLPCFTACSTAYGINFSQDSVELTSHFGYNHCILKDRRIFVRSLPFPPADYVAINTN